MNTQSWTILWLSLLLPAATAAGTVYSWTDADGVTHFSESPPADATLDIRRFEVDTPPAVQPAVDDDHFSVINQAARMQESRLENERARTERLQAEAEARRARAEAQAARRSQDDGDDYDRRYYPLYHSPWLPGHRPGHRPGRPGHLPSDPARKPARPRVGIPARP
jgi:hypothetical protein